MRGTVGRRLNFEKLFMDCTEEALRTQTCGGGTVGTQDVSVGTLGSDADSGNKETAWAIRPGALNSVRNQLARIHPTSNNKC